MAAVKKPRSTAPDKVQVQDSAAEWVPIGTLHGWDKNPKRHPEEQIKDLMRSIQRFGWGAVILATPQGEIIAGHGRLEAAKRLGLDRVPVRWMNLDPVEAHLLNLADNKLTELGEWDNALLSEILGDAKIDGVDITGLGWDDDALAALLSTATELPPDETYTRKIKAPIYEIRGLKPQVKDLYDRSKTDKLVADIRAADIPPEVSQFLEVAAQRHTVLNFAKIAEFYAHAQPDVQALMEASVLVIVDFDKAIEAGCVALNERLGQLAEVSDAE